MRTKLPALFRARVGPHDVRRRSPRQQAQSALSNCGSRASFTLIELLSAMAILMIMVLMMSVVFTESDRSWVLGTSRAEVNSSGRAALALLAHDLQYAVADDRLTFAMRLDTNRPPFRSVSYGFTNDEICFVSLENDSSDSNRTAREIFYWVRPVTTAPSQTNYQLVRSYYSWEIASDSPTHCYWNPRWYEEPLTGGAGRGAASNGVVADNVTGFAVFAATNLVTTNAFTTNLVMGAQSWRSEYLSLTQSNRVPEFVDILLELMDKDSRKQAAGMIAAGIASSNVLEFVDRNTKRFTTRVYFYNRNGYRAR